MTRYDLFQLRLCAHTALLRSERSRSSGSAPDRALVKWFVDNAGRLGCGPLPTLNLGDLEIGIGEVDRRTWIALKPVVEALGARRQAPPPSALERRLTWLCRTLSLSPLDGAILKLAVRSALFRPFQSLAALAGERNQPARQPMSGPNAIPPLRDGQRGRPRCRPYKLCADKTDNTRPRRQDCWAHGTVPRIARKSIESSERLGRHRWGEHALAWFNRIRRLPVRYERRSKDTRRY